MSINFETILTLWSHISRPVAKRYVYKCWDRFSPQVVQKLIISHSGRYSKLVTFQSGNILSVKAENAQKKPRRLEAIQYNRIAQKGKKSCHSKKEKVFCSCCLLGFQIFRPDCLFVILITYLFYEISTSENGPYLLDLDAANKPEKNLHPVSQDCKEIILCKSQPNCITCWLLH